VDDGGSIEILNPNTFGGQLNPQNQLNPATGPGYETTEWRSESGLVLTQAFQGFLGQTSVVEWGKRAYGPTENGGISGVVYYSTTRAEDDPRYGVPEPWEPGIPGVTVNLYDETGTTLLDTTTTDSWDATPPADCKWGNDLDGPFVFRDREIDCYDGMRNWNQVRPGVFDGGYAFDGLDPGRYVVEVIPPAGYSIVRSQDKNVDFGDEYEISGLLLPPECFGTPYTVPQYLSLNDVPWVDAGDKVEAPLWNQSMPDCDRKLVTLSNGSNSAADFFLFTQVPAAAHAVGFILDDTANEFDPNSPQFGEKYAPPFLPVGIRDWTGREIGRTYSDEYGRYNFLTASTWTNNLDQPSGMSPNMITTCMNAKLKADQSSDLLHNSQYSQFCYTFQYMPGATVYLDTPVVPVAAFTGANQFPLDCEYEDGTPRVYSATNGSNGPWLPADVGTLTITAMGSVDVPNPAYDGVGGTEPRLVPRDYNFGCPAPPTVTIGGVPATVGSCTTGTDGRDVLTVTTGAGTATGQLVISRADTGLSTVNAVTVHVGGAPPTVVTAPASFPNGAIQAAIDGAEFTPGQLITVAPGNYQEMVIMWNPVRLQGWGEGTTIDAVKTPPEALQLWRDTVASLVEGMKITLLPGQEAAFGGIEPAALWTEEGAGVIVLAKAGDFAGVGASIDGFNITGADTGGGIIVNGYAADLQISNNRVINNSGFYGGGVRVGHPFLVTNGAGCPDGGPDPCYPDAMNDNVVIRHNYIGQNGGVQGAGGGVSLCTGSDGYQLTDNYICGNFNMQQGGGVAHFGLSDGGLIARNAIVFNDSFNQGPNSSPAGGGVLIAGQPALAPALLSLGSGDVDVDSNLILGNAAEAGDGGGIRLQQVNGQDVADANNRPSTWHRIDIVNNIVANNLAALAGGGISLFDAKRTFINHNSIANNDSTATAGAAFSAGSTADLRSEGQLGAGIVSRRHSDALIAVQRSNNAIYSDPRMSDNIVWHNRTFLFNGLGTTPDPNLGGASWFGLCPDIGGIADNCPVDLGGWSGIDPYYSDIAVLGVPGTTTLNCDPCIVSDLGGPDPVFVAEYVTGGREPTVEQPEQQTIFTPTAFDEGGNFIRLRFGPLTRWDPVTGDLFGDYHLDLGSPAIDTGAEPDPAYDFDQEPRPNGADPDIGADEYYPAAAMMAVPAGAFDSSAARAHGAN
jgi:hypothetical protein